MELSKNQFKNYMQIRKDAEENLNRIDSLLKKPDSRNTGVGYYGGHIARDRQDRSAHFHDVTIPHLFLITNVRNLPKPTMYTTWNESLVPDWDARFIEGNSLIQEENSEDEEEAALKRAALHASVYGFSPSATLNMTATAKEQKFGNLNSTGGSKNNHELDERRLSMGGRMGSDRYVHYIGRLLWNCFLLLLT